MSAQADKVLLSAINYKVLELVSGSSEDFASLKRIAFDKNSSTNSHLYDQRILKKFSAAVHLLKSALLGDSLIFYAQESPESLIREIKNPSSIFENLQHILHHNGCLEGKILLVSINILNSHIFPKELYPNLSRMNLKILHELDKVIALMRLTLTLDEIQELPQKEVSKFVDEAFSDREMGIYQKRMFYDLLKKKEDHQKNLRIVK